MKSLLDIIVLVVIYFLGFYRKWRREGKDKLLVKTLLYIYLGFVIYFTLMPVITSLPSMFDHSYRPMNLTPFIDVSYGRGDFMRQIILNIIMMVPFGFLLPLVGPKNARFLKVLFLTFLLSFSIEVIQPLMSSGRMSDITDVITNVTGGIIGYILYMALQPVTNKILSLLEPTRPKRKKIDSEL